MTIDETITHAVKEGYQVSVFDGIDMCYDRANTEWSVWSRADNDSSFMVPVEAMFLDPLFWQALGRALRWDHAIKTIRVVDNGRPTMVTSTGQSWLSHWHGFIDHLARGHTAESFFARVPSPVLEHPQRPWTS
jgi:hypothetical protein